MTMLVTFSWRFLIILAPERTMCNRSVRGDEAPNTGVGVSWGRIGSAWDAHGEKHRKGELSYGTTTNYLPPAPGNPGTLATILSDGGGITPRPVWSVVPANGDHPGAGPAGATAPRRTPAHNADHAGAATNPAGPGDLRVSVWALVARAVPGPAWMEHAGCAAWPALGSYLHLGSVAFMHTLPTGQAIGEPWCLENVPVAWHGLHLRLTSSGVDRQRGRHRRAAGEGIMRRKVEWWNHAVLLTGKHTRYVNMYGIELKEKERWSVSPGPYI